MVGEPVEDLFFVYLIDSLPLYTGIRISYDIYNHVFRNKFQNVIDHAGNPANDIR